MTEFKTVAGAVLQDEEGRYLLVQEKRQDAYGQWNLPAGHRDPGESDEEAAIREAKEEVGYDIEIKGEPLHNEEDSVKGTRKVAFRGRIVGGKLSVPADELLGAQWLTYEEIEKLNDQSSIRSGWVMTAINKARNHENTRD